MSDDKTKHAPQDASRISLNEEYEFRYWTETFGVSKEVLTAAVKSVGHGVKAINRYLTKNKK